MFGYIECNRAKLSQEELARYQSVYCGLCRNLKDRFGELERMSLSYDMTFAILFLSSLYEPEEETVEFRCGMHPLKPRIGVENKFTHYAADMTIALAYYRRWTTGRTRKRRESAGMQARLRRHIKRWRRLIRDSAGRYPAVFRSWIL